MAMNQKDKLVLTVLIFATLSGLWAGCAMASDCDEAESLFQQICRSGLSPDKEIEKLRIAIKKCPGHANALIRLADIMISSPGFNKANKIEQNRLMDEAAELYEKAIEFDNKNQQVYWSLARVYFSQGRMERAAWCYQRILELSPKDTDARKALKKLGRTLSHQEGKLRTAEEIKNSVQSASEARKPSLMGIANFTEPKHRERFNNITFDEWKYDLKKENEPQLLEIGKAVRDLQHKGLNFIIEGHTDNRGDKDRNQTLSENRARAVKEYLVQKFNVDPSRIQTQGFGFNRPLVPNDSQENMARNRRVEVLFLESQP